MLIVLRKYIAEYELTISAVVVVRKEEQQK